MAIPTITARAESAARVTGWWRARGVEPVVELQDPALPVGPASHVATCMTVIRRALDAFPQARHLLLCEDDVELDPALPGLASMLLCGRVVTLWTTRLAHLPAWMVRTVQRGDPLPSRTLVRAVGLRSWHGSLGLILPRDVAERVLAAPVRRGGFDMHLKDWLIEHDVPLWVAVPNLVQHLPLPRQATRGGPRWVRSATFGWPVTGENTPRGASAREER